MRTQFEVTNKRERLIEASITCFHQIGYERVSLAQIAAKANVPLGNVYYYFKTKAALAQAVVLAWQDRVNSNFKELDTLPEPKQKLLGFLKRSNKAKNIYTEFGCPLANLARDLMASKEAELSELAKDVYVNYYKWTEEQFRRLGYKKSDAKLKSRFFVASLQGAILLAHANQDESVLTDQIKLLKKWVIDLTQKPAA